MYWKVVSVVSVLLGGLVVSCWSAHHGVGHRWYSWAASGHLRHHRELSVNELEKLQSNEQMWF